MRRDAASNPRDAGATQKVIAPNDVWWLLGFVAHLVDDFFEGLEVAGFLDEGIEPVFVAAADDVIAFVSAGKDDFCIGANLADFGEGLAAIHIRHGEVQENKFYFVHVFPK